MLCNNHIVFCIGVAMREFAVGILCKDRFELTQKTLLSLYYSNQPYETYDLYLIDNGSGPYAKQRLKEWVSANLLKVKNIFFTNDLYPSRSWNLFLNITKDYPYRLLLDNDIVFHNTSVASTAPPRRSVSAGVTSGGDVGANPGCVPSASIVKGVGHFTRKKSISAPDSCFLDILKDSCSKQNAGICSLAVLLPGQTFSATLAHLSLQRFRDRPFVKGGCMFISKECFDRIGYLDDRLFTHYDVQYSQRALLNSINITYATTYCAYHLGHDQPTVDPAILQNKEAESLNIIDSEELDRNFVHTAWEKVEKKIRKKIADHSLVHVT